MIASYVRIGEPATQVPNSLVAAGEAPVLAELPAASLGIAVCLSFYFTGLRLKFSKREEIVHLHTKPE